MPAQLGGLALLLCLQLPTAAAASTYDQQIAQLAAKRTELAKAYATAATDEERAKVLARAEAAVFDAIVNELIPAWYGTPWEFYGTSQTPGEGAIACGYFVTTILRDAGFQVERVRLAQQASEHIIKTLVGEGRIERYRYKSSREVAEATAARGEGLYVVGLDCHVGFLAVKDGETRFLHSSYMSPLCVVNEKAATSMPFQSDYRVVGKLLDGPMLVAWLEGRAFPTVGNVTE